MEEDLFFQILAKQISQYSKIDNTIRRKKARKIIAQAYGLGCYKYVINRMIEKGFLKQVNCDKLLVVKA